VTRTETDVPAIARRVQARFDAERRVLSFDEYLDLFRAHPWRHSRDAARYVRDCFEHFGSEEVVRPWGRARRWRLFDLPPEAEPGRDPETTATPQGAGENLVGHEGIQDAVYRFLSSFVREGRANRLILLHGPNGSAKTTFIQAMMRGLEVYSGTDQGALYCFSWIFPRGSDGKTIGFGSTDDSGRDQGSFAHLPDARIDVKLPSELREHPLLLLPASERQPLLQETYRNADIEERPPRWLWDGDLGHKNRQIFDALLTAYRGDLAQVLAHVQVERFAISRRYRRGAVTIGPQMAVDAAERQITADQTLGALPASLAALRLFESQGELVDASGGILEYSDLLKRPLDAWRYLLLAIENGEVSLSLSNLALNAVLVASSNELHLGAFKEHPEYNSFRGRLHLVRVPYLRDYRDEQRIYDNQLVPQIRRHVAPHTTLVAALWAVLTRLRRPKLDHYPGDEALGRVAHGLTPMEKADLYASGRIPERLDADEAKVLRAGIERIAREWDSADDYEGLSGASPREIRSVLLGAAEEAARGCVSPLDVLDLIETFCRRKDYEFLKETPDQGYGDHRGFVDQVRHRWLELVDDELRTASGLVEETQYRDLFDRYVNQVSAWSKREQVYNRVTGDYEEPDVRFMGSIEETLGVPPSQADEFRRNLISGVAAHAIDHPGEPIDHARVFPRYIDRLRESYFEERRRQLRGIAEDVLMVLDDERLDPERQAAAEATRRSLEERHGYQATSLRVALGALLRERYREF